MLLSRYKLKVGKFCNLVEISQNAVAENKTRQDTSGTWNIFLIYLFRSVSLKFLNSSSLSKTERISETIVWKIVRDCNRKRKNLREKEEFVNEEEDNDIRSHTKFDVRLAAHDTR